MSEELEKDLDLEEAKVIDTDVKSADTETPEGEEDKKGKVDSKEKTESAKKDKKEESEEEEDEDESEDEKGLSEAVERLFEGTEFSEDFKTSAVAVFEAAVHEKVLAETSVLEEKFESDLQEQVDVAVEELVEKVDQYLDYVVENWMAENDPAVESNIKVEVAESLLSSIKGLVSEHNLEIDQEAVDHAAELEVKLEEASIKYNELVEQLIESKEAKLQADNEIAFKTVSEELTDTQAEKLRVLSEGISFESTDDYSKKLEAIKSNYFAESAPVVTEQETDLLQEETAEEVAPVLDASIASYAESLNRHNRFVK